MARKGRKDEDTTPEETPLTCHCGKPIYLKSLCRTHYNKHRRGKRIKAYYDYVAERKEFVYLRVGQDHPNLSRKEFDRLWRDQVVLPLLAKKDWPKREFRATLKINQKVVLNRLFHTKEEAVEAKAAAKKKYGLD